MVRKNIIIALFSLLLSGAAFGQQDPLYSQYMFNMVGINPAYAGSREVLSVTGLVRSQWVGVKGAPISKVLIADFSTKSKKVGLGMQVFNDQIGIMTTNGFNATYAYRIRFREGVFAMGLQGGVHQFKANYTAVQLMGSDYDPAFSSNANQVKPTFGAGLYYSTDKYYIGFSAPHMLNYKSKTAAEQENTALYQNNHWFLTGGYVFNLSHDLALKTSTMVRLVSGAPVTVDLNANLWFYNTVSLGLSARTSKMFVGLVEIQASRQFRFGYAYDYNAAKGLKNLSSHEVMLRYEFGYEKKGMISPRHF